MFQQKSFNTWSCENCKLANLQIFRECSSCKTPRSTTEASMNKPFGKGFAGPTFGTSLPPNIFGTQSNQTPPQSVVPTSTPSTPSTGWFKMDGDINLVQKPLQTPVHTPITNPQIELLATTNIPKMKDFKTMGLLICSAVAGKIDKIEDVNECGLAYDLFKSVINGEKIPTGTLTTVAPLAMLQFDKTVTKNILGGDTCEADNLDTCDVYLKLLRRLVKETLFRKDDILHYVLHEASLAQNKRLFFTVKFAETNPIALVQSIKNTEIDVINVFTVALIYFLHIEEPLKAFQAAELENIYFPKEVSKVLAGMLGASYGYKWIPDAWTTIPPYNNIIDTTKFFRTVGTYKMV